VDGELFFDINITPGASFASRTPKSAKFEVGGKGSGGVWKVSDKTRSGNLCLCRPKYFRNLDGFAIFEQNGQKRHGWCYNLDLI
jgi:hypothetical protein